VHKAHSKNAKHDFPRGSGGMPPRKFLKCFLRHKIAMLRIGSESLLQGNFIGSSCLPLLYFEIKHLGGQEPPLNPPLHTPCNMRESSIRHIDVHEYVYINIIP